MNPLNYIPEKYRATAMFAIAVLPYLTRAYHAVTNGGGLREMFSAIWFGTNTPQNNNKQQNTNEKHNP